MSSNLLQPKKTHRVRNFFLVVAALLLGIIVIGSLQTKHPTAPIPAPTATVTSPEPSPAPVATTPEPSPAPTAIVTFPEPSPAPVATTPEPSPAPTAIVTSPEPSVSSVKFSIVNVSTLQSLKRSVDVRLDQRVSEDVLRMMAQELYVPGYDRTFISYWLPYEEIGEGCWATTHFNPNLEIRVLGLTPEQLEVLVTIPSAAAVLPQEVIGTWLWELGGLSHRITLYQRHGVIYMEKLFLDGSNSNVKLTERASTQGRQFEENDANYGEYYLLDRHGDLHQGNSEGLFEKFQKIEPGIDHATAPSQSTTSSQTTTQPSPAPVATTTSTTSDQDTIGGSTGETVEAWVAAQQFVAKQLKSPSTAKFNGIARAPYVVYLGDRRYRVKASVDSQNSFGTMIRTEFEAIVRAERDEHQTWILESLDL